MGSGVGKNKRIQACDSQQTKCKQHYTRLKKKFKQEITIELLIRLVNQGLSQQIISEKIGCSKTHVARSLKKYSLQTTARPGPEPSKDRYCLNCKKQITKGQVKYCNFECLHDCKYRAYIKKWKKGDIKCRPLSDHIRRYLIEARGKKCEQCGWAEKNPVTRNITITVHHINQGEIQLL